MTTQLIDRAQHVPVPRIGQTAGGIGTFPTTACTASLEMCPWCVDCADDCADCLRCRVHECDRCALPDLTPRTAGMLALAGHTYRLGTADDLLHSRRPVFRHLVTRTFDELTRALERGECPRPQHLMAQLCLHLMISAAAQLSCDASERPVEHLPYSPYDYVFETLYDTLLADDAHLGALAEARRRCGPAPLFDFDALADALPPSRLNDLFAEFGA